MKYIIGIVHEYSIRHIFGVQLYIIIEVNSTKCKQQFANREQIKNVQSLFLGTFSRSNSMKNKKRNKN